MNTATKTIIPIREDERAQGAKRQDLASARNYGMPADDIHRRGGTAGCLPFKNNAHRGRFFGGRGNDLIARIVVQELLTSFE
jgi:hypothetical protein